MSQHYSNPRRQSDPYALPDVEIFYYNGGDFVEGEELEPGWYWQSCFPGCLPDSDPIGPFDSEDAALADAREQAENDDIEREIAQRER